MTKKLWADMEEARQTLRDHFVRPGDTVYCILRHVSRSGMYRAISLKVNRDGHMFDISRLAARACDIPYNTKHEALGMSGCGMDMGFHAVYVLSVCLFCPDKYDHDAAYSLKYSWL